MSTAVHRNSVVQVGNGIEYETARKRTIRRELSAAEIHSDHDLDLNKDTNGTRDMGRFMRLHLLQNLFSSMSHFSKHIELIMAICGYRAKRMWFQNIPKSIF